MNKKTTSGISAIVLAAGSSTRMGTAKPLVSVGGEPMLSRVLSTLQASRVDETVVVLGHAAELIQQSIAFGDAKPVVNASYLEGMASSIQLGLLSIRPDAKGALIVLADQPFLKPETIDLLIAEYLTAKPEIIVPLHNGFRGNPVLLDRCVFAEMAGLTGDMGCRAIFGNHTSGILKVAVDDAGVLVDLDTPADVRRAEQTVSAQAPASDLVNGVDLRGREEAGPWLVVVGNDPVAKTLVEFARPLAFQFVVVDPFANANDFPGVPVRRVLDLAEFAGPAETFVVVLSRGRFDEEAIDQALMIGARYVAVLASKKRAQELRSSLQLKGIAEEKLNRLRAPAGLDIGAVTPAEIALSIMAEIVAEGRQTRKS